MNQITAPPEKLGRKAQIKAHEHGGSWVQTERSGHEAWARLAIKSPIAAAVMHTLTARMGDKNAVVISQKTIAALLGVTDRSVRTAVQLLTAEQWVQVIRLNGPGTVCAYVVNSRIAWAERRDKLCLSVFSANVVADADDQISLDHGQLRQIPSLFVGERQLPTGPGEDPPAQPALPGLDVDLPITTIDKETGAIIGFN